MDNWPPPGQIADCRGLRLTGRPPASDLENANFTSATLIDADLRNCRLRCANFFSTEFSRVDLRGANLTNAKNLEYAQGLASVRVNDDTILEEINLEAVAQRYPLLSHRLKMIRYRGALKRRHLVVYLLWRITCGCGRSWGLLLVWGLLFVSLFALAYHFGAAHPNSRWLPNVAFLSGAQAGGSEQFLCAVEFSAMTFVGFNMPRADWSDLRTGLWVACEAWLGLAFIGVFITVVAVRLAARN